jgi:hypothetical protein
MPSGRGRRPHARTFHPWTKSASTSRAPINPVAPVTNAFRSGMPVACHMRGVGLRCHRPQALGRWAATGLQGQPGPATGLQGPRARLTGFLQGPRAGYWPPGPVQGPLLGFGAAGPATASRAGRAATALQGRPGCYWPPGPAGLLLASRAGRARHYMKTNGVQWPPPSVVVRMVWGWITARPVVASSKPRYWLVGPALGLAVVSVTVQSSPESFDTQR